MLQRVFEVHRARCRSLVRALAHSSCECSGGGAVRMSRRRHRPIKDRSMASFTTSATSSSSSSSSSAVASSVSWKRFQSTSAAATAQMMPDEDDDHEQHVDDEFMLRNEDATFPLRLERADWAVKACELERSMGPRRDVMNLGLSGARPEADPAHKTYLNWLREDDEFYQDRKFDMSEDEVNEWLMDREVPQELLDQCSTNEEVTELRQLFARQLRLEQSIRMLANEKRVKSVTKVKELGKSAKIGASQRLVIDWMRPLTEMIKEEKEQIKSMTRNAKDEDSLDRMAYGAMFMMLDANVLAAIAINTTLNLTLTIPEGVKLIKLALTVGNAVIEEIIENQEKAEKKRTHGEENKYHKRIMKQLENEPLKVQQSRSKTPDCIPKGDVKETLRRKVNEYYDNLDNLDKRIVLKTGAALVDFVLRSCVVPEHVLTNPKLQIKEDDPAHDITINNGQADVAQTNAQAQAASNTNFAFAHSYHRTKENGQQRRQGIITCDKRIIHMVFNDCPGDSILPWTARYLPMLVPPRDWQGVTNGGYYSLHTKILRQRDSAWQLDCVRQGEMKDLLEALNAMQRVPWVINKEVLDVILKVWARGDEFGDLPQRKKIIVPELREEIKQDPEKFQMWSRHAAKVHKLNRELHSLQCDTKYKLQVAEEFSQEKEIYYPYNMDFRGRVYPIPPNLNHLGSDLPRSLLVFRDRKPLGKHGLQWLKIHLANVYGVDKCSFDERVAFSDHHLDQVMASAANPLGEHPDEQWWQQADYPFLALGVCFEIRRALESGDPENYMSNLPVHQDGSCNGLQHYAALGRDEAGGAQVNLVPGPKPSDVYSGVASQVISKVEADAAMEIPVEGFFIDPEEQAHEHARIEELRKRKEHANFLLGNITRKVVKQTVMTSVYGVTYIGARKQIQARLDEAFTKKGHIVDKKLEDTIYGAACYCAELTMSSMTDLFSSARAIMNWLGECASLVSAEGQAMSWVTPMGLPVVQPYRRPGTQQVRTKVQHVLLQVTEARPVSAGRQRSAFPPNFVHSLDSTHMLMTAKRCLEEEDIAFAAVHDSYWTHAASVDTMNRVLREEFVHLYSQPILEELLEQLRARFPDTPFQDVPNRGQLDLNVVLKSPYFFN